MIKKLFWIILLLLLWNCMPKYFLPLPQKNASNERIDKARSFAEYYYNKCNTKDFSEIQGFVMDINTKKFGFSPEEIEKYCTKKTGRYGKITVGEFNKAITVARPTDFYDYFIFKANLEKSDSLKYIVVGLFRDKDIIGGMRFTGTANPKLVRTKRKQ